MTTEHSPSDFITSLSFEPLAEANWDKFTQLFGVKGACGNCWCMYPRLPKDKFNRGKLEEGNKNTMHEIVRSGKPTGILAFYGDQPIGWCAFAPREDFLKLEKSRVHKRIDDKAVWSIPCTFVDKKFRGQGVSVALLKGVINYARANGIKIIEAYPIIPTQEKLPDSFAWIGLYKSFGKAGFQIVDTTSRSRPMVRFYL